MKYIFVRKNDLVKILSGEDKGKQGKVLRVYPEEGRLLVERVKMVKRHTRPNPQRQVKGGIAEHESPIQISNVMVVCPDCGPTRVKRERVGATGAKAKHQRVCRKCGRVFDDKK